MIKFILNNKLISTNESPGMTTLDFIRYNKHLVGTKIGCREGDCGACTVLVGQLRDEKMIYNTMTSCIAPLGNMQGKHIVTIEGLNMEKMTPVQAAMVEESGTQCGFCTPGFVVSLSGFAMSSEEVTFKNAISAIDGNICRCTGYKSIERAAQIIVDQLQAKDLKDPVNWAIENNFIPIYFNTIPERLKEIIPLPAISKNGTSTKVGGGTDLYVQRHDDMHHADIDFLFDKTNLNGIHIKDNEVIIQGGATASDLLYSKELNAHFPNLWQHLKLVSSTPIRNMGTIAGNFVNASPIGDLTAFFIGLNASITLSDGANKRTILLKDFYKGYKILDKKPYEIIESVHFKIPDANTHFNFEKISKRRYLDIATVNSAMSLRLKDDIITEIYISAGGVGPTPLLLENTCNFLQGKILNIQNIQEALDFIQSEISPISDARGTAEYKRLALRQIVFAHFTECFPQTFKIEALI